MLFALVLVARWLLLLLRAVWGIRVCTGSVVARAAPPPTSKQEADHWRRGAQVPTGPVHTRIPQARASNNNNQRATSTNANNNAGAPGNNNAQNSRGRQGAPASKN